jgi:DNA-binding HxlR family transcriptional regulator
LPPSVEYALTDLGREFLPIIHSIMDVGRKLKARAAPAENSEQFAGIAAQ